MFSQYIENIILLYLIFLLMIGFSLWIRWIFVKTLYKLRIEHLLNSVIWPSRSKKLVCMLLFPISIHQWKSSWVNLLNNDIFITLGIRNFHISLLWSFSPNIFLWMPFRTSLLCIVKSSTVGRVYWTSCSNWAYSTFIIDDLCCQS